MHQHERCGNDREKRGDCDDKTPNDLCEHPNVLLRRSSFAAREPCFLGKPCQRIHLMTEFRRITPDFAVAGQIAATDVATAKQQGFVAIINNRPDQEEPGQPSGAEIKAAAEAAGLTYRSLPYAGQTPPGVVGETAMLLEQARGPVLAYCRTGTRSIKAWALAEALSGAKGPDEIIALAAQAGYDLEGARGALETLAPKS